MIAPLPRSDCSTIARPALRSATAVDDPFGERTAPGDENRARVRVVLRLRDEIRRDPGRPARAGDNHDLGRAGVEVDRAAARHHRLRGRDIAVAGADDLVDARHGPGAEGQRRDRVGAADPEQPGHAGLERRGHDRRLRPRADHDHLANAGDARRDRGHQQRGGQRKAAARDVAADAGQRLDALLDRDAARHLHVEVFRDLAEGHRGDVGRGLCDRPPHRRLDARGAVTHLRRGDLDRSRQAIEAFREARQRPIAAGPHLVDDPLDAPLEGAIAGAVGRREQPIDRSGVAGVDDLHIHPAYPPHATHQTLEHDLVERVFDDALARARP